MNIIAIEPDITTNNFPRTALRVETITATTPTANQVVAWRLVRCDPQNRAVCLCLAGSNCDVVDGEVPAGRKSGADPLVQRDAVGLRNARNG